jgi:hypothetical protein
MYWKVKKLLREMCNSGCGSCHGGVGYMCLRRRVAKVMGCCLGENKGGWFVDLASKTCEEKEKKKKKEKEERI